MNFARGVRVKEQNRIKNTQDGVMGLNSHAILVVKLPDSRAVRVLSRSLFLAVVLITLPCIGCILRGLSASPSRSYYDDSVDEFGSHLIDFELLDLLLHELHNEGLVKKSDKTVVVTPSIKGVIDEFLNANEIDFAMESDLGEEKMFPNATFDLGFALSIENTKLVDRVMKVGGIVVTKLSNGLWNALKKQSNYRVVYIRQYSSTIVAMRKTSLATQLLSSSLKRRLCQLGLDSKKAALKGLEDVLLEPPRPALTKSIKYLKKYKYLPDLLGDSLEDYPRRVFIDVGLKRDRNDVLRWFDKNYPTRNQEFEHFSIEMVPEGQSKRISPWQEVSIWLTKNVKRDEFVVMKAEAEVVEGLIKNKSIGLVDELFLECNNQWQNGEKRSKRAYWECLALYGRLRDDGIAVHQWWD